jgi:hypothetical protein
MSPLQGSLKAFSFFFLFFKFNVSMYSHASKIIKGGKSPFWLGTVARVYISVAWKVEIVIQGQPGQKVSKIPSLPNSQAQWYTSVIPAVWKT